MTGDSTAASYCFRILMLLVCLWALNEGLDTSSLLVI